MEEELMAFMLEKEIDHLPNNDYLNRLQDFEVIELLENRKEAIGWINNVHAHLNFGIRCWYLSINYLDRFLGIAYESSSMKDKPWAMKLLAVTCVRLASKLEEGGNGNNVVSLIYIDILEHGESEFLFEDRIIKRMEVSVLTALNWKMNAVTPLSFIGYFIGKLYRDEYGYNVDLVLKKSLRLVMSSVVGAIGFLGFKSSEVAAAAVAICVDDDDCEKGIEVVCNNECVEKERVVKCVAMFHELLMIDGLCISSSLDDALLPDAKRTKIR